MSFKKAIEHSKTRRKKSFRKHYWDFCSRVIRYKNKKQLRLDEKVELSDDKNAS